MQFLEAEILEITEETWGALLGLSISPCSTPEQACIPQKGISAHVQITGTWNGTVVLHGTHDLTGLAASQIFSMTRDDLTGQDHRDAIYELANIIAGNIKSLLPEPCQLSVPTVQEGTEVATELREAECVSRVVFECQGQPLWVSIWKNKGSE